VSAAVARALYSPRFDNAPYERIIIHPHPQKLLALVIQFSFKTSTAQSALYYILSYFIAEICIICILYRILWTLRVGI